MATPDFVTEARPVDVAIDLNDLDPAKGYKVSVKDNPKSLISLVEEVDPAIFQKEVLEDLQRIAAAAAADSSKCVLPVDRIGMLGRSQFAMRGFGIRPWLYFSCRSQTPARFPRPLL